MNTLDTYQHNISSFSPLRLDLSNSYKLLSLISKMNFSSVQPFSLPEFELYKLNPTYSSNFFHDSQTLSVFMESNVECIELAFNCVESFSISMYQLRSIIDDEIVNSFFLFQESIHLTAIESLINADFHCEQCEWNIKSLLDFRFSLDDLLVSADSILHGDLHGNNLIGNGSIFKIIDLENTHLGPAYSDVLLFSMLVNGAYQHLPHVLLNMKRGINRDLSFSVDVRHALCIAFIQYTRAINDKKNIVMDSIHNTFNQLNAIYPELLL